jgi:segregation and condensation protein B
MTMNPIELKSALEAIIYAADEPATVEQLAAAVGEEKHIVRSALDELVASYAADERGVEIRAVAGGYRVYTKPQHHDLVRRFIKSLRPPLRLTMPALETLAVIAYKQPVTQPEIQEIRGVNCAGVIETLLEKRLVTTAGRKQVIGRPILYRTSKDFLMRFGLSDVDELPSLKEFEALAREALGADDGIAASQEEVSEEEGEIAAGEALEAGAVAEDGAAEAEPGAEPGAGMDSAAASLSESITAVESAIAESPLASALAQSAVPEAPSAEPGEADAANAANAVAPEQPQESETSAWDTIGEPAPEDRGAKKAAPGSVD